ncbi:hypothetical protein [Novosphingobium sp.]|uniref:hypothetical protein n=1 Tax=Novosphingobium sp. TaxID=1874826 RepID=UPI00333E658C
MLTLFARHLLVLGVLLGLASQGIARETAPCREMAQAGMAAIHGVAGMTDMPGCAEMRHAGNGKMPGKATALCCIAMANCSVAIATDAGPPLGASIQPPLLAASWPAMRVLHGRKIAPDPDPPSFPA